MEEALERILRSGGVPSLAHPVRVAKNNWEKLAEYVGDLAGLGMRAIEVYHSEHSPADCAEFSRIAHRFDLIQTGGSDYHGENKPGISLGTGIDGNLRLPYSFLEEMKNMATGKRRTTV